MEFYLFVLCFLIFGAIINNKIFYYLSFLMLFFLSAFRTENVGTDVIQYKYYFKIVSDGKEIWTEPLWILINKAIVLLGGDFQMLLVISTLLVLSPLFYVFNKMGRYRNLCLLLYFLLYYFFYSLNIIRQGISSSFILLAFYFLSQRDKRKFIVSIIIASLFHKTALVALLILFFNKTFSKKIYLYSLFISVLVGIIFINQLLSVLLQIYPNYLFISLKSNLFKSILNVVLLNGFFIFFLNFIKEKNIWFNLFFLNVIVYNIFALIPFSERLNIIFGITQVMFFASILDNNKLIKKQKDIIFLLICCYSLIIFLMNFIKGNGDIHPYNNIFF